MKGAVVLLFGFLWMVPALAQDEGRMAAEFRKEGEALEKNCGSFDIGAVPSCAYSLATENPLHAAVGSIAPQNGVAFGPALVGHATPSETWRIHWSADGVVAPAGAWRAGAYANFVRTAVQAPGVTLGGAVPQPTGSLDDAYPVYSAYWQTASIDKLWFFGAGGVPPEAGPAVWTMKQSIVGGSALVPVKATGRLGLSVTGGLNIRMIRTDAAQETALDPLFAGANLADDRTFAQFSGGIRLRPSLGAHVKPAYRATFDRFVSGDDTRFSRWTVDLVHEFPFYRTERPGARDANTPNDCSAAPGQRACPSVTTDAAASRNRYGALSVRAMAVRSVGSVPYYLQPTLGGSDLNGARALASFEDYRFRAPNTLLLQLAVEHSLVAIKLPRNLALPLGVFAMAEQGKAADQWGDLFDRLRHSAAAGLTIRAGGFPEVYLLYAWGHEGHHAAATISTALLGGGSRPSLF